jgi:hypothetical protein
MYFFQHADKGAVHPTDIPIPRRRGGVPVAADPVVPVIGLREVERNLQGLTMGIPWHPPTLPVAQSRYQDLLFLCGPKNLGILPSLIGSSQPTVSSTHASP